MSEGNSNPPSVYKHGDANTCTCPHCWEVFKLEDALFVSRDPKLMGDPVLGESKQARFRPTRFSADGHAIDPGGFRCLELACPRCRLEIPRGLADFGSFFFSIIGTPSSGKSVFLSATTWHLRKVLVKQFGMTFADLEPQLNQIVHEYESKLFYPQDPTALAYIEKTQQQGRLYDAVKLDGVETYLPKPFIFSLRPQAHHPAAADKSLHRSMVLYDNAGEHFSPSQDTSRQPGTMHMARSECLMMVYDPTQDSRFRALLKDCSDPQLNTRFRVERQDVVFGEAVRRIRAHLGIAPDKKHKKWVIVIVNKSDTWRHLLKLPIRDEPTLVDSKLPVCGVDIGHIDDVSFSTRYLLNEVCSEIPALLEEFSSNVVYIPVSSLGHSPTFNEELKALEVVPNEIKPHWVTVPFLFALARMGILYRGRPPAPEGTPAAEVLGAGGGYVRCRMPDRTVLLVPERMIGQAIHDPRTNMVFHIPKQAVPQASKPPGHKAAAG